MDSNLAKLWVVFRIASYVVLASAFCVSIASNSHAAVIAFEALVIDRLDLAGPQIESQFQYEATIGDGWEVSRFTTANGHLSTYVNLEPSEVGDTVEFRRTNNGLFNFNSVDFATRRAFNSDDVTFIGFRNGILIDLLVISSSTGFATAFQTVASAFDGPIDLLKVQVNNTESNGMFLDNFDFALVAPVPLPAALPLFGTGLGIMGFIGWRRRRRAAEAAA